MDFWYRYGVMQKGATPRAWNLWASPRDPEVQTQQERQVVTPLAVGHRFGVTQDVIVDSHPEVPGEYCGVNRTQRWGFLLAYDAAAKTRDARRAS